MTDSLCRYDTMNAKEQQTCNNTFNNHYIYGWEGTQWNTKDQLIKGLCCLIISREKNLSELLNAEEFPRMFSTIPKLLEGATKIRSFHG